MNKIAKLTLLAFGFSLLTFGQAKHADDSGFKRLQPLFGEWTVLGHTTRSWGGRVLLQPGTQRSHCGTP